ncbi:MAG: COP23 domain-containing protein [Scytolyngbya sp. HA4215-MV1]|nr:COP23 domain-containing protein [Scytolyngbya sp. HA4215-MV1]
MPLQKSVPFALGTVLLLSHIGASQPVYAGTLTDLTDRLTSGELIAQVDSANPGDVVVPTEPDGQSSTPGTTTSADPRFICQTNQGQYTVMYRPESQPNQAYPWAVPSNMGGGWSAERRCSEISRRLEAYRPDGLLEMTTGVENGYNTICVTTEKVPSCRIVLTVPVGQDPRSTRDRVFENLTIADSGQPTQGVNALTGEDTDRLLNQVGELLNLPGSKQRSISDRSDSINLRPFLAPEDGGTATQLTHPRSTLMNRSLNPNRFR